MKLVVGLGNPGPRYETTRHNIGFLALDRLVERWNARGPEKKYQGEIYQAEVGGEKLLLVKPQTFMNVSGKCVAPIFNFYKCSPDDLLVIYDEIDLTPFALRIKTGGGAAGHNGIRSIDQHLGKDHQDYHRMRLGIGKPAKDVPGPNVSDYVLQQFTDGELKHLDLLLAEAAKAAETLVRNGAIEAMNQFNNFKVE